MKIFKLVYKIRLQVGAFLFLFIFFFVGCSNPEKNAVEEIRKKQLPSRCYYYLRNYPNGKYVSEVKDSLFSFIRKPDLSAYVFFRDHDLFQEIKDSIYYHLSKSNNPILWKKYYEIADSTDKINIKAGYQNSLNSAYDKALKRDDFSGWEDYIESVPPEEIKDAEEKMHSVLKREYPNNIGLIVITFPYGENQYTVEVNKANSKFKRVKSFNCSPSNASDSLFLPYGKYFIEVSAPEIMSYSTIEILDSPRLWIPLTTHRFTIKR